MEKTVMQTGFSIFLFNMFIIRCLFAFFGKQADDIQYHL